VQVTLLALAEYLEQVLEEKADSVDVNKAHDKVVYTAKVGKQVFVITCEESDPDTQEPSV
jgi:hypothetical protein